MHIHIDPNLKIPIYQQIIQSFKKFFIDGKIPQGTKMPSTRKLAEQLGINRLTVERAYQELIIDGLLESKPGSGTYAKTPPVLPPEKNEVQQTEFEKSIHDYQEPIFNLISYPPFNGINFASGSGDPNLFPLDSFRKTLQKTLTEKGVDSLVYGDPQGYYPLRESIGQILSSQGMPVNANQILITSGSHQGIFLVCQELLNPGDTILVENPTYAAGLKLFQSLHFNVIPVEVDQNGMKTESVEKIIQQHHPKLIYTIPNYHNPTGTCMSIHRRAELLNLASKYHIPILEDDYVGDLRYDGIVRPPLKALDQNGMVIYTGTFSKMLMPGIRVGYLVVTPQLIQRFTKQKYLTDLTSNNLLQHTLHAYVTVGRYQQHLNRACRAYKKRRDTMHKALKDHLSETCTWDLPHGGFFFWIKLNQGIEPEKLLIRCQTAGVNFAPGNLFYKSPGKTKTIRLNFAAVSEDKIIEGIHRIKHQLSQR